MGGNILRIPNALEGTNEKYNAFASQAALVWNFG